MENRHWIQWDRWMRVSHLYTGLFLAPWMLVYATSALCLNHGDLFTKRLHLAPTWKTEQETSFTPDASFPPQPEAQVDVVLRHLGLSGPRQLIGTPDGNQWTVIRMCCTGHYRITWNRQGSRLVVERQRPASLYSLVNCLHFQHGYGQLYFAPVAWAIVVDVVSISTVIWVVSGIWLWARNPRRRLWGSTCMIAGSLLFVGLAILLCQ
jgi:hypothetical protein